MKRLASIVAILLLAASAQAQTDAVPHKTKLVVPPKPLALRGPESPVPAAKPAPPPRWAANAYGAPPTDPGECRTGCAHSYYFCLAGDDASSCPQSWTSCQSACADPGLASP